ncbi:MAG: N-formylglutamate amidohydrolase [Chloroflexota bacterium]
MTGLELRFDEPWPEAPFEVISPSGPRTPVVAHIPHASTLVPAPVRDEIILDDAAVEQEVIHLTDWFTDDLFAFIGVGGGTMFVNRLSGLVFDPERFLDDADEPAAAYGQGVVYTHGSHGRRLRDDSAALRSARIEALYRPYHAALDGVVAGLLESFGGCTVIDCHSFPSMPLPSEFDQSPERPDICIGTDGMHTPRQLAEAMVSAFTAEGFSVKRDSPFAGTFVPSGYYHRDARVRSVMIEVRRGLYIDEQTAQRRADYEEVKAAISRAFANTNLLQLESSGPGSPRVGAGKEA